VALAPYPLLLPLNQTFLCYNGSLPIPCHDTSRILDLKIEEGEPPLHRKNEILADTTHLINQFSPSSP
jgi:hypothetical protein